MSKCLKGRDDMRKKPNLLVEHAEGQPVYSKYSKSLSK